MMSWLDLVWPRAKPAIYPVEPRDIPAIVAIHAASFNRGWSEDELERLLIDRNVIAHRLDLRRKLIGFILSRCAADEAEILSVAIAPGQRGRGYARPLLETHLRRLAGHGVHTVFLEVDAGNTPARRLYGRAGFRDVGRRRGYYPQQAGAASDALVLRRDLA